MRGLYPDSHQCTLLARYEPCSVPSTCFNSVHADQLADHGHDHGDVIATATATSMIMAISIGTDNGEGSDLRLLTDTDPDSSVLMDEQGEYPLFVS